MHPLIVGAPLVGARIAPHCLHRPHYRHALHCPASPASPCIDTHCPHCPALPHNDHAWQSLLSLPGNGWQCGHPQGSPLRSMSGNARIASHPRFFVTSPCRLSHPRTTQRLLLESQGAKQRRRKGMLRWSGNFSSTMFPLMSPRLCCFASWRYILLSGSSSHPFRPNSRVSCLTQVLIRSSVSSYWLVLSSARPTNQPSSTAEVSSNS